MYTVGGLFTAGVVGTEGTALGVPCGPLLRRPPVVGGGVPGSWVAATVPPR
jgi:hypothetical protein